MGVSSPTEIPADDFDEYEAAPLFFSTQSDLRIHLDGLFGDEVAHADALALRDQVQHEGPGFGPAHDWRPLFDRLNNNLVWAWLESDREGDIAQTERLA